MAGFPFARRCTMSFRLLLCLLVLSTSCFSHADTVWLRNGDRLTGKIKLYDSGKLLLATDFAGEIAIRAERIASVESAQQLEVRFADGEQQRYQGLQAGQPGEIGLPGPAPRSVALSAVQQMVPLQPLLKDWVWNGNIDGALDRKSGSKDTDKLDVRLKATARNGQWRNTLVGEYHREAKDEKVATDNYALEYSLDRFLGRHWFWQGKLEYERDWVDDPKIARAVGTGPGYQFWDNELGAFSLTALVNRNDFVFTDNQTWNFYSAGLKWDLKRHLLAKRLELFSDGELDKPDSRGFGIDYFVQGRLGIRYRMTSWASLSARTEWERISMTGGEGDVNDRRLVIGAGVNW
jgi:hypothetical protein